MAVTALTVRSGLFTGNGVAVSFPFTFNASDTDEVAVVTSKPLGPFTVTLLTDRTGTVTFATPPSDCATFRIESAPDFRQLIGFDNQGRALPRTLDEAEDRAAVQRLYLLDRTQRSIKLPAETVSPNDIVLPVAAARVNKWLGFDHNGDVVLKTDTMATEPSAVSRTFYVTMDGMDTNSGTNLARPLATINAALVKVAALNQPGIVIVQPGEYVVQPDTDIPTNCALYGYDLRVTKLRLPDCDRVNNMFRLTSGCKVRGFTFTGMAHESPPSYASTAAGLAAVALLDYFTVAGVLYRKVSTGAQLAGHDYPPSKGFAFVFKPGAFITRSPYISDCSVLNDFSYDQMTLPIDRAAGNPLMPKGMGNLRADGSVLAPSSPLRSVVIDSFTSINPNGYAYLMTRNAFVQLVSVFTNWSRYGLWCHDGGQVTVANSNSTFGDYALVSTGFRNTIRIPDPVGQPRGVYAAEANAIAAAATTIINQVWGDLVANQPIVSTFTPEQQALTRRDLATLLREIGDDLRSAQDRGSQFFVKGLFDWNAGYYFADSLLPVFLASYGYTLARIIANTAPGVGATAMLNSLFNLISTNVDTPPKIGFASQLEATGQQFSYVGSGVNYNSLPFSQRGTGVAIDPTQANLKVDGGQIFATFSTERGDTYLGDDLKVDFVRGTVEGQAFSRGVQNIALPLIQALGV